MTNDKRSTIIMLGLTAAGLIIIFAALTSDLYPAIEYNTFEKKYLNEEDHIEKTQTGQNQRSEESVEPATEKADGLIGQGEDEIEENTEIIGKTGNDDNGLSNDDYKQSAGYYPVYLVGAVKKPGIYEINESIYLYQLLELAGGMSEDAAGEYINLASTITGNMFVRIPTISEWEENPHMIWLTGGEPAVYSRNSFQSDTGSPDKININTASQEELESLPGVGPATAMAILRYREQNGLFSAPEEIMLVPGIKENKFASIKDLIRI